MNITGVIRLHYGADYLPWVIRSFAPIARKIVLLYTEVSNFRPDIDPARNPDRRETLKAIAETVDPARTIWAEGLPVDVYSALKVVPETDVILELDADEIISPRLCGSILDALDRGALTAQVYRLPMIHHWRSFGYVCRNPGWPTRLFIPRNGGDAEAYFEGGYEVGVIHHFGYCRRRAEMEYKALLSMHRDEWRGDWWEAKYNRFPEVLQDVHPCVEGLWDAAPYDRAALPDLLRDHPYYGLEVVE